MFASISAGATVSATLSGGIEDGIAASISASATVSGSLAGVRAPSHGLWVSAGGGSSRYDEPVPRRRKRAAKVEPVVVSLSARISARSALTATIGFVRDDAMEVIELLLWLDEPRPPRRKLPQWGRGNAVHAREA
jgi:hypothetical protein